LVDTLKDFRERRFAGLDQEMDMVAHEDIGVQVIMISVPIDEEELKKFIVVGGLFEDLLALVPTRDHVVKCAFKLNAGLTGHEGGYHEKNRMSILKSDPSSTSMSPK
jgi:hypothetical protein